MEKSQFFTPAQLKAIAETDNPVVKALAEACLSTYEVHASLERMLVESLAKIDFTK